MIHVGHPYDGGHLFVMIVFLKFCAISCYPGDLGHVTSVTNPTVEEGDCHYLPKEILSDEFDHLAKCDMFSLGLTIYQAGGGHNLPRNGPQWHSIRDGDLPSLPHLSAELNQLLKVSTKSKLNRLMASFSCKI